MKRTKFALGLLALGIGVISTAFTSGKAVKFQNGWFLPASNADAIGTMANSASKTAANYPQYFGPAAPQLLGIPSSGNCSANSGNTCSAEFTITAAGGAGTYQGQYVTGQYNY